MEECLTCIDWNVSLAEYQRIVFMERRRHNGYVGSQCFIVVVHSHPEYRSSLEDDFSVFCIEAFVRLGLVYRGDDATRNGDDAIGVDAVVEGGAFEVPATDEYFSVTFHSFATHACRMNGDVCAVAVMLSPSIRIKNNKRPLIGLIQTYLRLPRKGEKTSYSYFPSVISLMVSGR